jgi:hypothetical protein
MHLGLRIRRFAATLLCIAPVLLLLTSCSDSDRSPTAPGMGTATLEGNVVRGSGANGLEPKSTGIGLGGVTVRVVGTERSATTDGSGNFRLTGVPVGSVELEFERSDIHARGHVTLTSGGTHSMTFAIVGSRAVDTPRGHAGEEIEGLVQALDGGAGTLTVLDQRLGAVRVVTDADTLVRRGDATISLSDIQVGQRVHVKALAQDDGTYLATEVLLQNENIGGQREVSGSVTSVDAGTGSFVVDASGTSITVVTDSRTTYKRRGGPASFADVGAGASVEVKGILQSDGTILARQVRIES